MGERSPHNDPDARAAFIGMSMDTTREDMTQAVLEGVAFGLRDSLEVARSIGIQSGAYEDLRRRSQEPAVEEDYCKCDEYESGRHRERGRSGLRCGHPGGSRLRRISVPSKRLRKSW